MLNRVCLPLSVWDEIKHAWPEGRFFNYGGGLGFCVIQMNSGEAASGLVEHVRNAYDLTPKQAYDF